jgi:abhydrolase domain-containing protein 17
MKFIKNLILCTISLLVMTYIGFIVFAKYFSHDQIFPAPAPHYQLTSDLINIKIEDGRTTYAQYWPCEDARHTILFSHGNAEDLGTIRDRMKELTEHGFAVLSYEYPGYGHSEGPISEEGNYQAILAAYRYLVNQRGIAPRDIIAYGYSLGGGPSIELASQEPIGGLVLEATFLSVFRVVTHYQILPWDVFSNCTKIGNVKCPVFFVHGTRDTTVPFWHSLALYDMTSAPKIGLWLDGAGHRYIPLFGAERYWGHMDNLTAMMDAVSGQGT